MLRDVMREISVPSTANPPLTRPTPSYRLSLDRPFARAYTSYTSPRVSKLCSSFADAQTVLLEPDMALGLFTCDYADRLDLYSSHILMLLRLFVTPYLLAHGPLGPA